MGVEYRESVGRRGERIFVSYTREKQIPSHCSRKWPNRDATETKEWSTDQLTAEEVKGLLLPKDNTKETALHSAALRGRTEVLQKLWELGNEKLTPV